MSITTRYMERFGEPEPAEEVFLRTQQDKDGWRDVEKDVSQIVPVGRNREVGRPQGCGPGWR